jgi:signal transduction histidine kinase
VGRWRVIFEKRKACAASIDPTPLLEQKNSRIRLGNGAGLGLTLVKEWIEEMGGTVTVESVVGYGSCFTIRLPPIKA